MPITTNIMAAAIAAPATLFVMSNVASSTAQISHDTDKAVKRTMYVTGGVLLASAIATGDATIFLSTAIAVAAVVYLTYPIYFGEKLHVIPNAA